MPAKTNEPITKKTIKPKNKENRVLVNKIIAFITDTFIEKYVFIENDI